MVDVGGVVTAVVFGGVLVGVIFLLFRDRTPPPAEPPNPLLDSPAVSASLAALAAQLGPGGRAGWLTVETGGERAAVEALVRSLQPGLPEEGAFAVNRLVGSAPVRLTGEVRAGVPVITSVERLDRPGSG